jgi:CDP-diacylglycerol--serine O-phosphatidyltransferase
MRKNYPEIFVLPSFFSIANVFFGYLSLISCFHASFAWAAFWIILAAVMDGLDGIIARSTGTQSDFGTQLDSLSDAFSFGAAPSILLYFWGLRAAGTAGAVFSFIFLTGGILRLARYNIIQKSQTSRRYYVGLTVPSASIFLSSLIILHPKPLESKLEAAGLALIVAFIAFCMISRIKYRNFLSFDLRKKIDLRTALALASIISGLIYYPRFFLVGFFSLNVLSGPTASVFHSLSRSRKSLDTGESTL